MKTLRDERVMQMARWRRDGLVTDAVWEELKECMRQNEFVLTGSGLLLYRDDRAQVLVDIRNGTIR